MEYTKARTLDSERSADTVAISLSVHTKAIMLRKYNMSLRHPHALSDVPARALWRTIQVCPADPSADPSTGDIMDLFPAYLTEIGGKQVVTRDMRKHALRMLLA